MKGGNINDSVVENRIAEWSGKQNRDREGEETKQGTTISGKVLQRVLHPDPTYVPWSVSCDLKFAPVQEMGAGLLYFCAHQSLSKGALGRPICLLKLTPEPHGWVPHDQLTEKEKK